MAKASEKTDTGTLTLDGVEYPVAGLDDEAKKLATQLVMTDQHLAELQARVAFAKTARVRYIDQLRQQLAK